MTWVDIAAKMVESNNDGVKFAPLANIAGVDIVHDEDGTVGEAFHSISDHFEWVANEKIAFVTHWMPLPSLPEKEKNDD